MSGVEIIPAVAAGLSLAGQVRKFVKKHTDPKRADRILADAWKIILSEENTRRFNRLNELEPSKAVVLEKRREVVSQALTDAEGTFAEVSKWKIEFRVQLAKDVFRKAEAFQTRLHRDSAQADWKEAQKQRLLKEAAQNTDLIGDKFALKGRGLSIALRHPNGTVLNMEEVDGYMAVELNSDTSKLISEGKANIVANIQHKSNGQTMNVTLPVKLSEADANEELAVPAEMQSRGQTNIMLVEPDIVMATVLEHLVSQNLSLCPDAVDSLDAKIRRLDVLN